MHSLTHTIEDKQHALEAYERYFMGGVSVLLEVPRVGGNSLIEEWRLFCVKEKATYHALNMFEGEDLAMRATCWYPETEEETIRKVLQTCSIEHQCTALLLSDNNSALPDLHGSTSIDVTKTPPTYIKVNEFTWAFQELVDTYGIPRYLEVNPALFTCVTFPFLFGIMFGDIGHGMFILIFSLYLIIRKDSIENASGDGVLKNFTKARYMLLLMGIFAVYAGFIYNDFLSLGIDIFGSSYHRSQNTAVPKDDYSPYIFGIDPAWKGSTNELLFTNSLKMKLSVILGVTHMLLGILCKGINAIRFNSKTDFLFEFIPQFVFMVCTFLYMDFLIIYKWVVVSNIKPPIVKTMIDMFMGYVGLADKNDSIANEMFYGQANFQNILVSIAVICIPLMLIPKPLILLLSHNKKVKLEASTTRHRQLDPEIGGVSPRWADSPAPEDPHTNHHDGKQMQEFEFGEVLIHQIIETIEFVLGAVSNTASYLRLWALSLAHSQLASVFFQKIMVDLAFNSSYPILKPVLTFILFIMFMSITGGIILGMDTMECFLHALRLQWVEFQSKFYKGDGYKFVPFCHRDLLLESNNNENYNNE
eukprot:GHVR01047340.1.p1 GENE.GHVR01047340.1~~GHVR01047340.1.p1  ORF type:complete len:588 (+),score=72.40 GHVR01047340.1:526-2289(+)